MAIWQRGSHLRHHYAYSMPFACKATEFCTAFSVDADCLARQWRIKQKIINQKGAEAVISPAPPRQRTLRDGVFATAEPPRKHNQDHIHANMTPYSSHDIRTCLIRCIWVGLPVYYNFPSHTSQLRCCWLTKSTLKTNPLRHTHHTRQSHKNGTVQYSTLAEFSCWFCI
jgi:hypothetical protein